MVQTGNFHCNDCHTTVSNHKRRRHYFTPERDEEGKIIKYIKGGRCEEIQATRNIKRMVKARRQRRVIKPQLSEKDVSVRLARLLTHNRLPLQPTVSSEE